MSCSTVIESGEQSPSADAAIFIAADASTIIPPDAETAPLPCAEGDGQVTGADDTCYMLFFTTPLSWVSAQAACLGVSANLVSIADLAEQAIVGGLAGMVPGNTPDVWMGGNDQATENSFQWNDGSVLGYTNWRSGEPNDNGPNETGEDCMLIEGDNPAKEWDDRSCARALPYLCKRTPQ